MRQRLLLILLLLSLNGCAYIATVSGDLEIQVDRWVAQQEYGKALAALDRISPQRADYAQLAQKREAILAMAARYENETVAQAAELGRQGQWGQALERYDTALSRLPDSSVLKDGRTRLREQQAIRLAQVELDVLIARGEGLVQLLPAYSARAAVDVGSWQAERELRATRKEAEQVGIELTRHGRSALERKDLETARRCLTVALRLHPSPEAMQANQELQQQLGPPPAPAPKVVSKTRRDEETRDLLQSYRQAYAKREWVEAGRLLKSLEQLPAPPEELAPLRRQLDAKIKETVAQHTEQGAAFYSAGKYEQALASWRKAQHLDPDNERVKAHIERAERVLDKLRTLKQKNTGEQ